MSAHNVKLEVSAYVLSGLASLALIIGFIVDRDVVVGMGLEDRFAEDLTAILYLAAGALSLGAYIRSGSDDNVFFGMPFRRNVWLLLLAIFFFICFGEEISWGQRIFQWSTPPEWSAINGHHETNIHNLFDKRPIGFSGDQLYALIFCVYCVAVPLMDRLSLGKPLLRWTGVPVPPLSLAGIFVTILVVYLILWKSPLWSDSHTAKAIREWREVGYAFAYAVIALSFYLAPRSTRADE